MALWQKARVPSGYHELWCEELGSPSGLALLRRRLRRETTGSPTVADPEHDHWSERLVLIADELTSNALRHGGSPVAAALSRAADFWMIEVRDSSTQVPPEPAQGRDPGIGGFGLYLVADLSADHGWFLERGAKTVWAALRADAVPA